MRVAVLGVGLIGGSIGLAARECVEDVEVVGFGRSAERLEQARELGAIDRVAGSLDEALDGASVCFCCAPVGALDAQVAAALAAAGDDCVVTDVGSTKGGVVEAAADGRFVGGHPIAGAETAGVEHARADLFQGATWYLTPTRDSSGVLFERLHRLVAALGARPVAIDAESHDRLLATVSHLPHVLANALVTQTAGALGEEDAALPRVGPSFRDATRVAGANSAIWTDIYVANREAIAAEVDALVERLQDAAELLRAGDAAAITSWNEQAADARRRLLEADLAGGVVHELRTTVPNRPGIVAEVALALGRAGVNIVDMALAPAPDMRSGAITLWIAGDAEADRARQLIDDLGFPVAEA
ncbi:MAG TPA: prephenate dehydrogenase/arogenate dehydrogenase family protein [Thermoleophilaceae bacterium]|nr:prephenate dehydrogenase/arogenate dehydrogenase family protein [Thermoleophilaceae bacterium]